MHISGRYFYRDIQNFPDQLDRPHFWYSTPTHLDMIMALLWAKVVGIFIRWASGLFCQCDFLMEYWLFVAVMYHKSDIQKTVAVESQTLEFSPQSSVLSKWGSLPFTAVICVLSMRFSFCLNWNHLELLCIPTAQLEKRCAQMITRC